MKVSEQFNDLTWEDAMALPEKLNKEKHLGFSDWRVPIIKELFLGFDRDAGKPAPGWEGTTGWLWSSSSYANDTNLAWGVAFDDGYVGTGYKDGGPSVRCVRP